LLAIGSAFAQEPAAPAADAETLQDSIRELREQVRELRSAISEVKSESARYREETLALRQELQQARSLWASQKVTPQSAQAESVAADSTSRDQSNIPQRVGKLEEDQQLLAGKIDDQYQTKVESASKYKVRFSGIVLFNLAGNSGHVDDIDVPMLALPNDTFNHGSFTGTLRQSELGFEAFGPAVLGARSSANVQFDFAGGSPADLNGATTGIARLRLGTVNLDWANTSLVGGQDALFFSPNSPTSFATLAIPALAYSGNLWSWTPQLRLEHRFSVAETSKIILQGGILDPLTGEPPNGESFQFYRVPQAGESTRQPGYGTRVAWSHPASGDAITLGVGAYYSRQNWGFSRDVNAWAGTADWSVPLGRRFAVSGEFYRGRAIGGLGGSLGRSVIWDRPLSDPASIVLPLNSIGGWTQVKFKAAPKLEFNGAFGQDSTFASDLKALANEFSYLDANLARNRAFFGNVIYRPRSDLLFAFEYRRLRTADAYGMNQNVNHLNLSMGVLF
jgi:regulator of replication initiation timing